MTSTWADVKKGSLVELGGRAWTVVKIKPKGKKATVIVEHKGRTAESVVKLKERVKIIAKRDGSKRGPLRGADGANRRWATKKEHDAVLGSSALPAGDPSVTKPPSKPSSDRWEKPRDKTERILADIMQARLVAESPDERSGYYVPPVGITTVAAHLALFHGGIPDAVVDDEAKMLAAHAAQHAEAIKGLPLAVNHWHTETRPKGS